MVSPPVTVVLRPQCRRLVLRSRCEHANRRRRVDERGGARPSGGAKFTELSRRGHVTFTARSYVANDCANGYLPRERRGNAGRLSGPPPTGEPPRPLR